jgi:hypothetical protein
MFSVAQIILRGLVGNHELEPVWKETVVAKFKAVSQQLPEGTEENYERSQSKLPMSGLGFELRTFLIECMSVNHSTVFFRFKKR